MSPKNILFIIPPYFNIQDYISEEKKSILPTFTIPYGVLSIDSYLKKYSKYQVNTELLDLNLEIYKIINQNQYKDSYIEELISIKLKKNFNIVAISALFNTCYNYIESILSAVKNGNPPPITVMGGGLASNLYDKILPEFPLLDGICYGEGEIPMTELINSNNYVELMSSHPSWMTLKSLKNKKTPTASYVENLDDIPIFTYKIVNLNEYNNRSLDIYNKNNTSRKELSIHTSRGCPFKCVYCANISLHGNRIRYMSIERVVGEVDVMIKEFGMNTLLIEDDHFLGNKKRAASILKELTKRNINIEFPNGLAVYAIDEEIGLLLKNAGVGTVNLAVESGSDFVLKNLINKPLKKSYIKRAVDILRSNGIRCHAFIVIGIPGEMDEHRAETIIMIKETGFDWVHFFIAIPIAGSRLYDLCIDSNYLVEKDFRNHIISKGAIRAPGVDPEEIVRISYTMNLEVNFIFNYNLVSQNYEIAISYFKNIMQKYPEHAFVYYALSECYKLSSKDINLAKQYASNFQKIINSDPEWRFYAEHFGLLDYE